MQKKPFLLIICIAVVIIAIILLVIYIAKGGSTDIKDITGVKNVQELEIPNLELLAYPTEETDGDVEISIIASIAGKNEIISVTMPDGNTTGYSSDKTFTVNQNGEYTFTIKASNGKEVTKTIMIDNIIKISADNPYVPEGFTHVDGTEVATGFTIQDKAENQYVWVPVETGKPTRNAPSDKYLEDDDTSSAFNNSVAKYYGFYIAKYEASSDNVNGIIIARSVGGEIPWKNVSYEDAYNASRNTAVAYNYIGVKTALLNSYAWDTALDWIDGSITNYSSSRNFGNYSNQILPTGSTESDIVNGISDMSGNLREWTTEKYDEAIISTDNKNEVTNKTENVTGKKSLELSYRVVRGGSATMDKIARSRIGERTDLQDNYWGYRIVLYKE